MVTFSIPGDHEAAEPSNATPRSRPGLAFSRRSNVSSPYHTAPKRLGTPQGSSARKTLITRDGVPSSSLNRSFSAQNSIFNSSHIDRSPQTTPFSPSLSHTPMKKVFAPGATPEPSRVQRESVAHATPRGVAARAKEKDLFPMRIEEPSKELTGEALAKKVPKEWDPKGSIYADQFLGHLCPPDLDDEQRRQYFCVLDLRRLKFAADEIFCKKGWKLNVLNFAKEFEKSRSIILLHYGLYEFQNVKPSKELIKKWRREHGLPALEDDEAEATPSKPTSTKKKRKASDDVDEDTRSSFGKSKRVATEKNDEATAAPVFASASAATPGQGKNKRKASVSDDTEGQPNKVQKAPSSARSLFEKAANKTSTTPSATPAKPNPFAPKPTSNSLMQSVLKNNAKTDAAQQPAANGNIFGHLSDNSSAKNSSPEADAESDTESEPDESPEEAQSDEPKAKRPASFGAAQTGASSDAGTRESTPSRSLFDRVTKDGEGQPVRAETPVESSSAPKDQTWNPGTTPIKFAPSGGAAPAGGSLFNNSGTGPLFAPKPTTTTSSTLFGAPKQDKPAEIEPSSKDAESSGKDGDESDKENGSNGPSQTAPESKSTAPQPAFGSLFQPKPASADSSKENESAQAAPTPNLFGGLSAAKPAAPTTSNLFGAASKPAENSSNDAPVMQSSTLFGAKAAEPQKALPAPGASTDASSAPTSSLFGGKPPSTGSNLFGNSSASAPSKPLFGNVGSSGEAKKDSTTTAPASSTPTFSFGGQSIGGSKPVDAAQTASKPLFGAPKSPPAAAGTNSMFDGSPMKQDDKSPAKPLFGAASNATSVPSTSQFSFGGNTQNAPPSNLFGASSSNPPANSSGSSSNIFGGAASTPAPAPTPAPAGGSGAGGGFNFNFGAGGGASNGTGFNNPFSGGDNKAENAFNFGANSSAPSAGGPFQFGGNSGASTPGGGAFGANQTSTNGAPAPAFGAGTPAPASGPTFSFGAGSSQPQTNSAPIFGGNQGSTGPSFLQPPSGGASTGTSKSPFPGRKILPLKRRV